MPVATTCDWCGEDLTRQPCSNVLLVVARVHASPEVGLIPQNQQQQKQVGVVCDPCIALYLDVALRLLRTRITETEPPQ